MHEEIDNKDEMGDIKQWVDVRRNKGNQEEG